MRKQYSDDICDRCRVYPKDLPFILCNKCKNEWIAFGIKVMADKKIIVNRKDFEVWFKTKKKIFIFR